MASSGHLKPGEKGQIIATVDVRGKLGIISKTIEVFSNDPKRPRVVLTLSMNVKDVMHSKKYNPDKIFTSKCSGCHVDDGSGKRGKDLFAADCAMCHNSGKTASPINSMRGISSDRLKTAIESGVNGSSMPGWLVSNGGPLTSEEIRSLIEFINGK